MKPYQPYATPFQFYLLLFSTQFSLQNDKASFRTHHTETLHCSVDRTVVTNCEHNKFNMVVTLVFGSSKKKLHISKTPFIPPIFKTPCWTMPVLPHYQSLELRPNCNHLLSSFDPIPSHTLYSDATKSIQSVSIFMVYNVHVKNWFTWLHKLEQWDIIKLHEFLAFNKTVYIFLKNILECHEIEPGTSRLVVRDPDH